MYMGNPYPRWVSPPWNSNTKSQTYIDYFGLGACSSWRKGVDQTCKSMLVAGCGTGLHPISCAILFPEMDVTAIDISAASLAYAKMKADHLGINNIKFKQADILAVSEWDKKFDIIESVGVLHHLKDPELGLRGLLKLLSPGGGLNWAIIPLPLAGILFSLEKITLMSSKLIRIREFGKYTSAFLWMKVSRNIARFWSLVISFRLAAVGI